ncbi:MAG: hypothetical protein K2H85_05055, partial [Allobaculum sp.]|nr:hypothetical protein [Allobaculum sp.]
DYMRENVLLNLGADIIETGIDIPRLVKNRIVIIGDFTEDDTHDTYIGKIAGPVININALEALRNNELEIPWWLIVFLFGLYTTLTYLSIRNKLLIPRFIRKFIKQRKLLRYLLSFIGYSMFFSIIGGVIYIIRGMDINIILPSLWFTFIKGITNTIKS